MIANLDKINIIKREKILNGLKYIEKLDENDNVIDKILIFGSAVRDDCTENSDIDICYSSKYPLKSFQISKFFGDFPLFANDICDIIPFEEVDGSLKRTIVTNGITVYEYTKN